MLPLEYSSRERATSFIIFTFFFLLITSFRYFSFDIIYKECHFSLPTMENSFQQRKVSRSHPFWDSDDDVAVVVEAVVDSSL
jgi:hypothetical protein